MEINKKIFICFLLVLMLFVCVNAASASDSIDTNLTSEDTVDLQSVDAVDASQDKLSGSGDTLYVGNENGDYKTISAAVSAATGGETIFIRNGNYTDSLTFTKSVNLVGESKEGVSIKTGSSSALIATTSGNNPLLSFENITFKDSARTSSGVMSFMGDGNVTFTNCNFIDLSSKYGAIQTNTAGTITISKCTFSNIKEKSNSPGTGLMYLNGAGTTNIYDCVIENCGYEASSGQMNALIYEYSKSGTLNIVKTTIVNTTGAAGSLIRSAGKVNIKDSVIANNTVSLSSAGYVGDSLFYVTNEMNIETSIISNNVGPKLLLYKNTMADFTMNYCNVQGNTFDGGFTDAAAGDYDANNNYWGSNDKPADVTASTWIVEDNGEYKYNNGTPLEVIIPDLNEEPQEEPIVLPEGTIYVSPSGNDTNDGLSKETAIATIAHAVEIAKAKDNKTSTVYLLNGDYNTAPVDITEVNITFIGQQKGNVVIHGTGKYIFDVYGEHLISKFENIDFVDSYSPSGNMGALRLYADYSDFTLNNCNFRNISAKYGAIDLQGDYGTVTISNCVVEDVTGSTSMSAIVYVYADESTVNFDNIEITNCALDEKYAQENPTNYLRAVFYVASKSATVTLTNSRITNNNGANYGGVIESKSKLTINNTIISDNVVNTSVNGNNGGEYLIWASDDKADISIANSIITGNTIVKTTKGLFYNQKGSISVEYSDLSNNNVEKFVGGTGTITANNNWWGTNDQPDSKIGNWVIMNVVTDTSDLRENNKVTFTIDFNHVKTADGSIENLTGGEIPKDSYSVAISAKNGNITPTNLVVNKGQNVTKTFTVTELNDEITLSCDGDNVVIPIEAIPPYRGIIYVNVTGDDANDGTIDAPVANITKAIELANKGSHQIIINEGTYIGNNYHITGNLTVTGVGKVTLDANNTGRLFYMNYGDNADKIELHNLILTNANGYGAAVYSFADELILNNVTIVNNQATGYLISSRGKLTIKDSEITNSMSGDVIQQSGSGDILIQNTAFENNVITDASSVYAVVNLASGSGNLVVEDSKFINNTARQGVIKGNYNYNIKVDGCTFIDNVNTVSNGGAIYAAGNTLTVTGSTFINNKAEKDGGAIAIGFRTTATVDKSVFINNSVTGTGYHGDAIYNGNKLTVNNCVLLTNAKKYVIYNDGEDNVVNAQRNWWGTNDNPKDLVASGTYEDDDWEEQDCAEVDVSNWVKMTAKYVPSLVLPNDEVTITAEFDNVNLPDGIEVTFTSNGGLNTVVATKDAKATTTYTITAGDENITAKSSNAEIVMPIVLKVSGVVTNDTFYNYFDEDGILKDTVTANELVFKGDFSDVADYVIINKPMQVVGDNAVFKNIGFVIASEDVSLNNLTLVATKSLGDLINVGQSNVDLINLNISYIVDDEMANAINVNGIGTVSNVNILNNNIYFESHVTSDEDLTTAINLDNVEDVIVDGNDITANIPALYVETYDYAYFMMGLSYVNPIRIYEAESVELINNKINVTVNDFSADYPTVQALYVVGSSDILIKGNNVTMRDTLTPSGTAIYLYAVECGFSSGILFIENNFDILTTGGKSGAGSAYALQIATSDAVIIGNNITCDSNGPNLGIYSPYGFGPAKDLVIKDNFINVSGYAAGTSSYALISGIEVQTGYAVIYNNTIHANNKGTYNDRYPVSAVSALQYSASTLSFDIQDNKIYTNGKYAVNINYAVTKGIVTGNFMLSNLLKGDDAAYIKSGTTKVIENNFPTVGVVTNKTFFNYFDDNGVLKEDENYIGLTFKGNFSDLVDTIVINKRFIINSDDAVLNNIALKIESDKVQVSGLTFKADKEFADNHGAVIYATGSNIEISNVTVNYTAPSEKEAIAIYANAANEFTLSNSKIIYVATNPGEKHNYGLEVRDSNNVSIKNNKIDATLPAVLVDYNSGATGIDQDLVLAVGIQGGKNINFTSNVVTVSNNGGVDGYATVDAIMMDSVGNLLINCNNISHVDTKSSGIRCYNGIDLYAVSAIIENNNVLINTTSGVEGSGSAYPIQLTGPFTVVVNNNNLTTISNGPSLGIFAANSWYVPGASDLTVTNNFINVTGYAGQSPYALVSGIESQVTVSKIYNNAIYAYHIGDYADGNNIYGVSLAQYGSGSFDVKDNNITTNGKYAVYFNNVANSNVTYNTLFTRELAGDEAVYIGSGENNVVENNQPPYHVEIRIDVKGNWEGNANLVKILVTNSTGALATGKVVLKINGGEFTLPLKNGTTELYIPANLLVVGVNEIFVDYINDTILFYGTSNSAKFNILNGTVTQDNYLDYFNQEDNGKFFDYVPEGVTLDFQGSIINPDQAITVQMNVNKPVNIISTTKDAYIDLNTTAGSLLGESPGNSFAITYGGSGSNVSGINFHNTQLWISNTHNIILDNISNIVEDQNVGSGVGATTIRDNSSHVLLKNSYFYTRNNGGSSTFTMSWATYCTIDNCTVRAEGNVGNLIYLNVYNIVGAPSGVPLNNYNTVSNNRIYGKEGSGISVALMVEGTNNLIINNTLYKSSISTSFGAVGPANNTYVGNVATEGGSLTAQANSIVYGNNVAGKLTTGEGSVAYDNIVGDSMTVTKNSKAYNNSVATSMTVQAGSTAYDNTVGTSMTLSATASSRIATAYNNIIGTTMTVAAGAVAYNNSVGTTMTISGANAVVENNTIGGAITIAKAATGTKLVGNTIKAMVTVNSNNNIIKDNNITVTGDYTIDLKTTTGNEVTGNYLVAKLYKGDASVKFTNANNVVKDNLPQAPMTVVANNAWTGNNATVTVTVPNTAGSVTVSVNGKNQTVDLVDGVATVEIANEDLETGANDVVVTYNGPEYAPFAINDQIVVLDGVITNETYKNYFDTNGNLASAVPDGATLDFQGLFLGNYPVYINKAVNAISSTGDALFDAGATFAGNAINSFNIVAGGDTTNITGLKFINYCLYIKGASNVTVDGVSIVANKRGVGSGTGFLSIHTGAYNTLVKNGYFENGGTGSSLLVLGKGGAYATFDHNIFNITGSSGNILSANQFVGSGNAPEHVAYTNNVLYNNQPGSAFCYAMTVSGSGNLLENNTIYHNGSGILNQYGASSTGNVYRNNTLYGNTNFNPSANSIVENNRIYATTNIAANTVVSGNTFTTVAISGTGTKFTDNIVTGTVTVSGNNNELKANNITATGDYAIDLKSTTGNTVTDNYLVAKSHNGDAAVKFTNANNIVKDNLPKAPIVIAAESTWIGNNATVTITVANATGKVTVSINGKNQTADLVNGSAKVVIAAEDLVAHENIVTVTYNGPEYGVSTVDGQVFVLDGVITNETYKYYFDSNGNLVSAVSDGATLDFQGLFLGKYPVYINKAVNAISSTGDALFDAGATFAGNAINSFNIVAGGDTTNITGLKFINYCLYIKGASNVTVDGVSIVANKRGVGSGTGFLSIHTGAYNTLVKNGYFENGGTGSSLLVLGKGGAYATFDHNIFNITGSSGNILSANQYVGTGNNPEHVAYTNNVLYNNQPGSAFCYAMTVSGSGNLLENNTIYHNGSGILNQYGASSTGNVYRNNTLYGNTNFNPSANSIVENNRIYATTNIAANTVVSGNTFTTVAISGTGTKFTDNIVTGTVTVSGNNNELKANNITSTGDYAIDLKSTTGNTVTENRLVSNLGEGDVCVKYSGSNVVKDNYRMVVDLSVSVDDIKAGETAIVNVSISTRATGSVQVIVGGIKYDVPVKNGSGSLELPNLAVSQYAVSVAYNGDINFLAGENTTSFTVSKIESDAIITTSDLVIGEDVNVTVTIAGATGDVTVIVDGKKQVLPLVDGSAKFTIEAISAGSHFITATYMGDGAHGFATNTTKFTIDKIATEITLEDIAADYGTAIPIKFTIAEDATGKVYFDINGEKFTRALVNGGVDFAIADLVKGTYDLSASYEGDAMYASSNKTIQITVNGLDAGLKANASDIKVGENATISIEISSDATGAVVVILDKEYAVNIVDGKGTAVISDLANGTYTAVVKFAGDNKFSANETTATFTVSKEEIPSDTNVTMDIPEGTTAPEFTIQLPEGATGNVTITVDGKYNYTAEVVNGTATVKVPEQTPGDHEISAVYSGDDKYSAFSNTEKVNIPKATIPGGEDAINTTSPSNATGTSYSIKLPENATGNFTVTVDGKDNYTVPVVNGSATVTIPELAPGNHNITVSYSGDDKFASISKNISVNVPEKAKPTPTQPVKVATKIIAKNKKFKAKKKTKKYKVTLKAKGKPVKKVKVTLKIKGKTYKAKTNAKGKATFKIKKLTKKGKYKAVIKFAGNKNYKASSKKVKITVK